MPSLTDSLHSPFLSCIPLLMGKGHASEKMQYAEHKSSVCYPGNKLAQRASAITGKSESPRVPTYTYHIPTCYQGIKANEVTLLSVNTCIFLCLVLALLFVLHVSLNTHLAYRVLTFIRLRIRSRCAVFHSALQGPLYDATCICVLKLCPSQTYAK